MALLARQLLVFSSCLLAATAGQTQLHALISNHHDVLVSQDIWVGIVYIEGAKVAMRTYIGYNDS